MVEALVYINVGWTLLLTAATMVLWVEHRATKQSTHQVTFYDPNKQKFEEISDQTKEKFEKGYTEVAHKGMI